MRRPPNSPLAQLNIGRIRYELDNPRMADFTNNLAVVNGLAERTPGFVWRYVDDSGNATDTRPYADPLAFNSRSMPTACAAAGNRRSAGPRTALPGLGDRQARRLVRRA